MKLVVGAECFVVTPAHVTFTSGDNERLVLREVPTVINAMLFCEFWNDRSDEFSYDFCEARLYFGSGFVF